MKHVLKNIKGLYIGDICYALEDEIYDGVWGKNDYEDGMYEAKDGLHFAVGGTAYGDGSYLGSDGFEYSVDAGVIGVVDLRLATRYSLEELKRLGKVIPGATKVEFNTEDGYFDIKIFEGDDNVYSFDIDTREEDMEWDEEF